MAGTRTNTTFSPESVIELSAMIQYQLSGAPINWEFVQKLILPVELSILESEIFEAGLKYIHLAYGSQKRRLGPMSVLHPMRAAHHVADVCAATSILELLTALLHDKDEDLLECTFTEEQLPAVQNAYKYFLSRLTPETQQRLESNICALCRTPNESYREYLERLFSEEAELTSLIRVKLADRLDNTLDLRLDTQEDISHEEFNNQLIELLFHGKPLDCSAQKHPMERQLNGSLRLYQLSKNIDLLSVLRQSEVHLGICSRKLERELLIASRHEAQNIVSHLLLHHVTEYADQRRIIGNVQQFCNNPENLMKFLTTSDPTSFSAYFNHESKEARLQSLKILYADKHEMLWLSMLMTVIFSKFIVDLTLTSIP